MKKAVSFSIFGDNPKYLVGLEKNIELCSRIYPDWTVNVHYDNSVPSEYIESYGSNRNVRLFDKSGSNLPGMVWRFFPEECDVIICRDADSRVGVREKEAVSEWLESSKTLHVMRDHPHHNFRILGGMGGLKFNRSDFNMSSEIENYFGQSPNRDVFSRMVDMDFLGDRVYASFMNDMMVHDSYYSINPDSLSFPNKMIDNRFVGEIYEADDTRNYQYQEWINKTEK